MNDFFGIFVILIIVFIIKCFWVWIWFIEVCRVLIKWLNCFGVRWNLWKIFSIKFDVLEVWWLLWLNLLIVNCRFWNLLCSLLNFLWVSLGLILIFFLLLLFLLLLFLFLFLFLFLMIVLFLFVRFVLESLELMWVVVGVLVFMLLGLMKFEIRLVRCSFLVWIWLNCLRI